MEIIVTITPATERRLERMTHETGRATENIVAEAAEIAAFKHFENRDFDPGAVPSTRHNKDGVTAISPWIPETNPVLLAALGKLGEELCEAGARAMRCVVHGVGEIDPDTKRPNIIELSRELADVHAATAALQCVTDLHVSSDRRNNKLNGFLRWFDMIRAHGAETKNGSSE